MVIFKIDGKGSMFYSVDKQLSSIVDKLHKEIQPIVCSVDEYFKAMESAPPLTARDFDMPYRNSRQELSLQLPTKQTL